MENLLVLWPQSTAFDFCSIVAVKVSIVLYSRLSKTENKSGGQVDLQASKILRIILFFELNRQHLFCTKLCR